MILPKKIKTKWLKALRSGKYKQGMSVLYHAGNKSFCCLGVLEHVCMNGNVEVYTGMYQDRDSDVRYKCSPSPQFYEAYDIVGDKVEANDHVYFDPQVSKLMQMNDTFASFKDIADWIEKNVETK